MQRSDTRLVWQVTISHPPAFIDITTGHVEVTQLQGWVWGLRAACFSLVLYCVYWTGLQMRKRGVWSTEPYRCRVKNGGDKLNADCLSSQGTWDTFMKCRGTGRGKPACQKMCVCFNSAQPQQTCLAEEPNEATRVMYMDYLTVPRRCVHAFTLWLPSKLSFCCCVPICPQITTQQCPVHEELWGSCL